MKIQSLRILNSFSVDIYFCCIPQPVLVSAILQLGTANSQLSEIFQAYTNFYLKALKKWTGILNNEAVNNTGFNTGSPTKQKFKNN